MRKQLPKGMINPLKQSAIKLLGGSLCSKLFAPIRKDLVPVFMLHRVRNVAQGVEGHSPEFLEQALSYLTNSGYTFISLAEMVRCMNMNVVLPKNAVAFTCDDGFWDQAEITASILEKYNCPLTIFLITGFIDGEPLPWDDRVKYVLTETRKQAIDITLDGDSLHFKLDSLELKEHAIHALRDRLKECAHAEFLRVMKELEVCAEVETTRCPPHYHRPLTWDQARALEKRNVQFAPHTVTHAILSKTSDETAKYEIHYSWRRLQEELEHPLPVFCYPTGRESDFGSREIALIKEAGFEIAVSTTPGYVHIRHDNTADRRFRLNRFSFPRTMTDLIQYASWIERCKELLRHQ